MESLPNNLIIMIASYLDNAIDSANFRLVNQYCARIGAEEHFHYFPFGHCTPNKALERMQGLAASPLVKHIRGLDYDEEYEPDDKAHLQRSANCRVVAQVAQSFFDAGAKIELVQAQRLGFRMFSPSFGYDLDAFARVFQHVKDMSLGFEKVSREGLEYEEVFTIEKNIREFLGRLEILEILSVSFEQLNSGRVWHSLRNVVPYERKWKGLKSLHFNNIAAQGLDLVSILRNHSDTLTCIHWDNMRLESRIDHEGYGKTKGQQWRDVFEQFGKMSLKHGSVHEGWVFGREEEKVAWKVKGNTATEMIIMTDLRKYLHGREDEEAGESDEVGEGE
jgi:hypothetical protein